MTKLEHCPMCGAAPILDGKSDDCRVRCESCGVQGPLAFFNGEDDEQIERAEAACIAAWNRRACTASEPDPRPDGIESASAPAAAEPAHSKSEYKRRVALGDPRVLPPVPETRNKGGE